MPAMRSRVASKLVFLCPCCRAGCSAEGDGTAKFNALRRHLRDAHSVSDAQLERFIEMADTAVEEQRHGPAVDSPDDGEVGEDQADSEAEAELEAADAEAEELEDEEAETATAAVVTNDPTDADADILVVPEAAEEQLYRCQCCHATARTLEGLLQHQRESGHLDKQSQTPRGPGFLCWRKGCNQYFKDLETLQMHFTEIHAKTARPGALESRFPHGCGACCLAFRDPRALERHERQHATGPAPCLVCRRDLSPAEARSHYETLHLSAGRGSGSRSRAQLAEPRTASPPAASVAAASPPESEEAPREECCVPAAGGGAYRCDLCQVGFGAQIQLAAHMRSNSHKRLAACRCPLCGAACSGQEHLKAHLKTHQLPLFLPPLLLPFPLPPPPPPPPPPRSPSTSAARTSPAASQPSLLCHFLPPLIPSPMTKPSVASAPPPVAAAVASHAPNGCATTSPRPPAPAATTQTTTSMTAASTSTTSTSTTSGTIAGAASGEGGKSGSGSGDSGSGSGSGGGQQNGKRARTRITEDQLRVLKSNFNLNSSPNDQLTAQMSRDTGLPIKVIKHWFRNTLFKERQRCKDSPYNFSIPPATQLNLEEYEKTGKVEVQPAKPEEIEQHVRVQLHSQAVGAARRKRPRQSTEATPAAPTALPTTKENRQDSVSPDILASHDVDSDISECKRARMEPTQPPHPLTVTDDASSWVVVDGRRGRTQITPAQRDQLGAFYLANSSPAGRQMDALAASIGLDGRVVRVWFQNSRARERRGSSGGGGEAGTPAKPGRQSSASPQPPQLSSAAAADDDDDWDDAPLDLSTAGQQQQLLLQHRPPQQHLPSAQQAGVLKILLQQLQLHHNCAPSEQQLEAVAATLGVPGRLIRAWLSNNAGGPTAAHHPLLPAWLGPPGGRCHLCAGDLPPDLPPSDHLYTRQHVDALFRAATEAAAAAAAVAAAAAAASAEAIDEVSDDSESQADGPTTSVRQVSAMVERESNSAGVTPFT